MEGLPDSFEVAPPLKKPATAPWGAPAITVNNEKSIDRPAFIAFQITDELKKSFGIELAKASDAFKAACLICGDDNSKALWLMQNYSNDPVVVASKDLYLKAAQNSDVLLDKDQLAARLLKMAEEKTANNAFYILDGKDRLKALELYAEVRGFTGKLAIDASTKNFTYQQIAVKFVKPETKEPIIIDNNENQILNNKSPLKLKLVS